MARFDGKKLVVTGGSSGIGRAAVERLLKEGAEVLATGTNAERLASVAKLGAHTLVNDAGQAGSEEALAAAVKEKLGAIDGAFLNAGFGRFAPLEHVSAEEFAAQYDVNVRGPLLQTKALAPLMKDGGSVLFNTSVAREMGMPASSIYAATKGAVRTLTRALAAELAPRSIRVNAVSPGPIGTDFFNRTGLSEEQIQGFGQMILQQVPLKRFGKPEEVAAVALFLLSEDASYVTGSEYVVDGGMSET